MAAKATQPRPHSVFFLSFILSFQRIERMPRQGNRHRKHGKEEEAHGEAYCEMLREAKPFFFFLTSSDPRPLLLFLLLSLFFSLSKTKKTKNETGPHLHRPLQRLAPPESRPSQGACERQSPLSFLRRRNNKKTKGSTSTSFQHKISKTFFQSVSGVLPSSSLTALMGPSGSSKTTLLDVLSGRTTAGTLAREGCVTYGGVREEFFGCSEVSSVVNFSKTKDEKKLTLQEKKKTLKKTGEADPGLPPTRLRLRRTARVARAQPDGVRDADVHSRAEALGEDDDAGREAAARRRGAREAQAQAVRARADRVGAGQGRERGPGQVRTFVVVFLFFLGGVKPARAKTFSFSLPSWLSDLMNEKKTRKRQKLKTHKTAPGESTSASRLWETRACSFSTSPRRASTRCTRTR